ncbi:MAG TPA: PKD domain-containing protein [Candidatus Limnocylindrales bacterium]|nr:PKD domain-containing protein [Candidatus Limnocylindrales bacterium]
MAPAALVAQGVQSGYSVTNYQMVSEQRISQTSSYVTYRADLVSTGPARTEVTASVTSLATNVQVIQGNLHFAPVPANGTVPSLDTFTLLVDRSVAFDLATLQWSFLAPVANAGPNLTAKIGDLVILDGTKSTNPSGVGTLLYNWKLTSTPVGSSTVLYWYDTAKPQFTVDLPGNYVFTLTVGNGYGSDVSTVTVSTTNTPPVANAGPNRTVSVGAVVTLNGSGSSDVDGDPLTYSWTFIGRPPTSNAILLAAATVNPVFTVDKAGSYQIQLIVNDGKVNSAPAIVTISTGNTPPVASAGPNQIQAVGALVQLDGSGSTDVDGDPLTYSWSFLNVPLGSAATLSSATAVKPTFTADRAGTYILQLIVNDGTVNSTPATVQITTNPPLAPTASAGPNQTVGHRTTVHLNGTGSDPQGLALTFQWSLTTKPTSSTAVLSNPTLQNPTFIADLPGTYIAQLIVNNGTLSSTPSMITITTTNTPPVANAGFTQVLPVPTTVVLDGSQSSDADNDTLTYAWSISSKPQNSQATLSSATAVSPSFIADVAGTYVIQLIVSDGYSTSVPSTVTITAGGTTITLTPNPLNVSTGTTGNLTVSLGTPAGPGGQIVTLFSSNGSIAAVQANVTVPQGLAGVNVPITAGAGIGSTVITALAAGFSPGATTVNVSSPSVAIALPSSVIGVSRTVSGVATLSAPAPNGGVNVTLSDAAGLVSFQPAVINIPAGTVTGTFTVTGNTAGSTTIVAGAPGYITGSTNVTVAMLGAITLLSNVVVGPGQSLPFPVSLVTGAPVGGVTISLSSSDPAKVTISPATVTIAQGETSPATQPVVTGVNLGSASISASAPGFFGDSKVVQVAATLSLQPQTLTVGINATQNLTLTLSGPAPASGLTINISSSNTAVATVPATVTIPATKATVVVPVTAVGLGTAVIHASAPPSLADTTANVNVVNLGAINLPVGATVGLAQSVPFPVTLPAPAPAGGVTVNLASSDTSKVTISPASVSILAGQTAPATQPTISGVNLGTANISANASGYSAASQPVQVTATLTFAQPTLTITGAGPSIMALNLSGPAPAPGLTVSLSSSSPNVAGVPATVTFPTGATAVNVSISGGTPGTSVVHASFTGIPDATLAVTVLAAGAITSPANASLGLGQSAPLIIALSSAPSAPVTVTLVSSDSSKVTVSPASVTIPAGQTTPVTVPMLTGVNIGSATLTATASGYTSATTAVQVGATVTFTQQSITINGTATQNLTLNLSAVAPAGGVTVNLTSTNTGAATVPASVTFASGTSTVNVPVTGVSAGTAVVHASNLPNIPDASANVTVQVLGTIGVPSNPTVGLSQTVSFPVTLSAPAPSAVTVSLSSSDTSKVTVSAASITIPQGATVPVQQPTITGVNLGNSTISANASGYASVSTSVQVTGSISFTPPTLSISGGGSQNLTLTLSGAAPAAGITVNLTSSNTGVATVPATATFTGGATTVSIPVTPVSPGNTVVHASNLPNLADTSATVSVLGGIAVPPSVTVAPGQQAPLQVTLGSPAPPAGVTVTLSTSDSTKAQLVSTSVFINGGQTTPNATPAILGVDFGNATVTASAAGYGSADATVHVSGSASFFPGTVSLTTGAGAQNISLSLSVPAPSNVTFALTSSNTAVATVPASVSIPASQNNVSVPVTAVGPGSAIITASTTTPNIPNATATANVSAPGSITMPSNVSVGLGKSVAFPISLAAPAASNVTISLSSSNPAKATILPATITIAAGQNAPAAQPQLSGLDIGAVTISASAPGYTTAATPVQVNATASYSPTALTLVGSAANQFVISLSGPAPVTGIALTLVSSNPSVATVPAQVTVFPDGSSVSSVVVTVTPVGPGSTVIHVSATPFIPDTTAAVTVSGPGTIGLPASTSLSPGQTAPFPITLGTPAPTGGVTVALSTSDSSKVSITPATVTIPAGQVSPASQPSVTGGNYGTATITATAPGYTTGNASVQVTTTIAFASPAITISGLTTQSVALNLASPAPPSGLTVNLTSGNTSVATVPATVTIPGNSSTTNVLVTAVGTGNATITAAPVVSGIASATLGVTVVTSGSIGVPASSGLGLGQTVSFPITLSTPAASPVTVALSSSDTSRVTVSPASVTIAAGQITPAVQPTMTGVNFGSATITASASGYSAGSSSIQVLATAVFAPPQITIDGVTTQNVALALSNPAPLGGVVMNLVSTNTSVATVPSTVTFAPGVSVMQVPVTSVAPGSATIHASSIPNIGDTTAGITVRGLISLASNVSLPPGQQVPLSVTLGSPAPNGGVTVTLTSSDPSKLTLVSGSAFIAAGQTSPATTPVVIGIDFGSADISASASGYAPASTTVKVAGSASFFPGTSTIVTGTGAHNLSLTLSVPAPAPVTFALSSSNTGVSTVPASVTIPANQTNVNVAVTPVAPGSATITASTTTPNIPNATASITVTAPGAINLPANLNVGLSASLPVTVSLGSPAPSGGVTVTLLSSDPTKLAISPASVTIAAGQTTPPTQPTATGINIGAVTLSASATGFTDAAVPAEVTATLVYNPPSLTIVGTATESFVVTLSGAAPASGIVVNVSSSNTAAATVPAQLTFMPNAGSPSTIIIPVTGVAPGSATIHVGAPPFIPDTTASVSVLSPGVIGLPANASVGPTKSISFPVTLGTAAPSGGVTVALSSTDTTKLTISPASVTIPQGQTTPATQPTITGVDYGTASINATAPGYTSATTAVNVTATVSFAAPTVTINGIANQTVALNLSAPAPAEGLSVNLTSSNTGVATVPATVNFASGATSVNVPITGLALGSTTITGTPTVSSIAAASVGVTLQSAGAVSLTASPTLGLGQAATLPVTLPSPAPATVTISLSSSDTSKVTVSPASVTIASGQTTPATQPTVTGVNLGSATISGSAAGYSPGTAPVQVNATISFAQNLNIVVGTGSQNVTLTLSAAAPAGGITVNLTSSNAAAATVPATVTFAQGQTSVQVPVTPVAPGSAVIHGSKLPNIADSTANVTVTSPVSLTLPSAPAVGLGATVTFPVTLSSAAPTDLTITLASSDTTKLTVSPATITILAGQTAPATQPTITGVNLGSASINASGPGITSASATVQVSATIAFGQSSATITGLATLSLPLNLSAAAPAGGLTFNLVSSNTVVATVPATVTIAQGSTSATVQVAAKSLGSTVITASTLAPNIPNATSNITVVTAGAIGVPSTPAVGLSKTAAFAITLPQPAPADVTVTLSSDNTSVLTVSPATVTISAGQTSPAAQPTVTGVKLGTANVTASAPGYTSSVAAVPVTATVSFTPPTLTISGFVTQNFTLTLSGAAPAGGLTINLTSSNPAVATVPATVNFAQGATTTSIPVSGISFGNAVIHASALPGIADTTGSVTVQSAGALQTPTTTSVSLGQSVTFAVTLPAPAASAVTLTVVSSDPSKTQVSSGPFIVAQGATTPTTQPQVTGVNIGSVTVTASAPGYTSSGGTVTTTATLNFAQPAVTLTGIVTQNVTLNLSAPAPAGGLIVNLSSATPSVATVPSTITFAPGASTASVPVTAVSLGSAVIHANVPTFIADTTTTVTVQGAGSVIAPSTSVVSLGASTPLTVTLSAPAPAALTVALSSSDNTIVAVSPATVSIAQGATAPATQPTLTGVNIGAATITVSAPGYTSASTAAQVNASVTFTPATATITGLNTKALTLTLSAPAPAAGLIVNTTSSNSAVATVPATVTFASGATTATVTVTGVALGSATIHASATTFIPDATASITVVTAGPIGLPSGVTAPLAGQATFTVTLPVAAPAGGVTVTLSSADSSKATVTPATVTIAAGQTTPATQPKVNGVNVGSTTISASAPGYTSSSQTVTIAATVGWPQPTLTATSFGPQSVTLTLSGAAPAGGLSVNLSSSNTLVATVPATATFAAGSTTTSAQVTTLSEGSTTLHASGLNIPDSTAVLTVSLPTNGIFTVSNVSVGQNLEAQIQVNLSNPVPAGQLNVTLTSSDPSKLLIGSLVSQGPVSGVTVLQFPQGTSSGIAYVQALASSGTVTVTASATGYTSGVGTVTLTPSGFVVTGPVPTVGVASFPTNVGNTTTLTISAARLNADLSFAEIQGIRGGFTIPVPITSSNTTVGGISPSSVTFTPADTAYVTTFTARAVGATLVSVPTPAGFSLPAGGANGITANVSPGGVTAPSITVGKNLEVTGQVTLTGAPSVDTIVTLTSNDPSRLLFGVNGTDGGAPVIPIPNCTPPVPDPNNACKIVKIRAGQNHTPDIFFYGMDSSASVTYTASVPAFGTATGTVSFQPSGILLEGPFGRGSSFSVATGSAPTTLTVESALLDASRNFVALQSVAPVPGVAPVSVNVTSSNASVGAISPSPVSIPAGSAGVTTSFIPGSAGSTTVSVNVPTGFSTPAQFTSLAATVSTAGIAASNDVSLGKFLQFQGNFALGAPAPAGGLQVTVSSNNTTSLLISASATAAGTNAVQIALPGGGFNGNYYLQGLTSSGTATYTVSAPGYASFTGTVTLTPSGVIVWDGVNPSSTVFGSNVVVSMAQLDATNQYVQVEQLAGGLPAVQVNIATSTGSITSPLTIPAGSSGVNTVLNAPQFSSPIVTATTPPGFTDSNFLMVTFLLF